MIRTFHTKRDGAYKRRWVVERFFAWMKHKRRLLNRWEFHPCNFLGFVQISAATLLLKRI